MSEPSHYASAGGPLARQQVARRSQQDRSAETRRSLADAAVACFHEMGFSEATLAVIAKRADVSRGAVQHHFGDRNDLLLALNEEFGDLLLGLNWPDPGAPLQARVASVIDETWAMVSNPRFTALIQIGLATRNSPEIGPKLRATMDRIERELDERWLLLFGDSRQPAARMVAMRHLVLATLRGLAVRGLMAQRPRDWRLELQLLKGLILTALTPA